VFVLTSSVMPYAWGSRRSLVELLGIENPRNEPQAELWMGAHPVAPSRRASDGASLLALIEKDPQALLGAVCHGRFGARLPFLLKVLAAETPLSLQAHPTLEQAKIGFDKDQAAGIPVEAPHRNYRDSNHKPELLCALTPFFALTGFREITTTLDLFTTLGVSELAPYLAELEGAPNAHGLRALVSRLMSGGIQKPALVDAVLAACARIPQTSRWAPEAQWALRIGELYPGDVGVINALLLNLVELAPGDATYLAAGNLHAYLSGTGVEIMANSDNVLRGGLTPKHVNVPELLAILDFSSGTIPLAERKQRGPERQYVTPTAEFLLSRIELGGDTWTSPERRGPEIMLCTEGEAVASSQTETLTLARGANAFVTGSEGPYRLNGRGVVYRATLGTF
jgi:mannose-6-phosphate isomerase